MNGGKCGVVDQSTPQSYDEHKSNFNVHFCSINYLNFLWS